MVACLTPVSELHKQPRKLELLAPAKNLEVGMAALLAGADAIYIGGSSFGARAAAGNDLNDIAQLCALAHRFGARIYLTVNTLLYDKELPAVRQMIQDAVQAGVDALIVQDPALLTFPEVQNLELHASTQWNINTLDKVDYCAQLGISQIVLPREFSVQQIKSFCTARPDLRFEVFVSGAMCVSVSGECFISEYMTKRSANRGECAQICRLPMELYHEVKGKLKKHGNLEQDNLPVSDLIAKGHLLSMKDNLRLEQLLSLVEAGACSFKIEGRLKDRDYVVNQVAAFRERLDIIIEQYPELYARASIGQVERKFTPDLSKTFNRGFTHSYLDDDNSDMIETRTPKSFGQNLGVMRWEQKGSANDARNESGGRGLSKRHQSLKSQGKNDSFNSNGAYNSKGSKSGGRKWENILSLTLNQDTQLANGDSFTYFNAQGELKGFRVNRVVESLNQPKDTSVVQARKGAQVYLFLAQSLADLDNGSVLYRNVDTSFIKQLEQPKAIQRKVKLHATVEFKQGTNEQSSNQQGLCIITFRDEYGRSGSAQHYFALTDQNPLSQVAMQDKLSKLGDEYLVLESSEIIGDSSLALFPISVFNQLRRNALASYVAYVQLSRFQLKALATRVVGGGDVPCHKVIVPHQLGQNAGTQEESKQAATPFDLDALSVNLLAQMHDIASQTQQTMPQVESQSEAQASQNGAGADICMSIPYLDTTVEDKVYHRPQYWPMWPENYVDPRLVTNKCSSEVLNASRDEPLASPRRLVAKAVMTCRTCLIKNHALCHKHGGSTTGFYLVIGGQRFDLVTDCKRCLMYVIPH